MIDQHKSLSEKFLKKGFWLYLFSFIIAPIWYIIKIIISWELSVSEVWILYWVISLITMVSAYNDLWLTDSMNYFIPQFITEKIESELKDANDQTVIALTGVASLFGFIKVKDLVDQIAPLIPGRLVVFFPGSYENNNYRLLDGYDGWNYLAVPITADTEH